MSKVLTKKLTLNNQLNLYQKEQNILKNTKKVFNTGEPYNYNKHFYWNYHVGSIFRHNCTNPSIWY